MADLVKCCSISTFTATKYETAMYRLSRDVFPSCFRKIGRLINEDVVIASSQSPSKN